MSIVEYKGTALPSLAAYAGCCRCCLIDTTMAEEAAHEVLTDLSLFSTSLFNVSPCTIPFPHKAPTSDPRLTFPPGGRDIPHVPHLFFSFYYTKSYEQS
jgi:hypothetical protein